MRAHQLFEAQVANADTLQKYCAQHASEVVDPVRSQWMEKASRRYISNIRTEMFLLHYKASDYKGYDKAFIDGMISDEMRPYFQHFLDTNTPFAIFLTAEEVDNPDLEDACDLLARQMSDVKNWLNSMPEGWTAYRNMDFATALRFAEAHAKKQALAQPDAVPVLTIGDFQWVELTSAAAVTAEGRLMRNCLKDQPRYGLNVENGDAKVYSLRDKNGRPHVTCYVVGDYVEQAKGKLNTTPKPIYQKAANLLFRHLKLRVEPWETSEWDHKPSLKETASTREPRSWINTEGTVIPVEGDDVEHDCVTWEHGLHGIEDAEYHGWIRINAAPARGEFNLEWRRGRVSKKAMRTAMQELRQGRYTTVIVDEDCTDTDRMHSRTFTDVNAAIRYCMAAAQKQSVPLDEAVGAFPTRTFRKLWHVGTMSASDKRQDSYEGAGLSVSLHPEDWRRIARGFVSGDTWEMTRPGNQFLDYWKIGKQRWAVIRQWAIENGWAEARTQYEVSWYDEEMDQRIAFVFDTREEAEAESDPEYNEDIRIREIPTGMTGTAKLAARCHQRGPTTSPQDLLATLYAEDVLGLDGVWWSDVFDPDRLSAPRGVIVPSKIKSWSSRKVA